MLNQNASCTIILAVAALASACDDGPGAGDDTGPQPDPTADPAPVTGTAIDIYVTAQEDRVPRDLTGANMEAWVLQADGGFTACSAMRTRDGTFEISGVPEGPYYLNLDGRFIVTSARTLDLDTRIVGRRTQHRIATSASLAFDVRGMIAWQPNDFLELYAPNAGAAFSSLELSSAAPPAVGATALDITTDYRVAELPMSIESSAGDRAFVTHNASRVSTEGVSYQALGAIAHLDPFSLTDGIGSATARGTFELVPQDRQRILDWRTTVFTSLISNAIPGGANSFSNSLVGFVDVDESSFYSIPALFNVTAPLNADVRATVSYGDPFPSAWKERVRVSVSGSKSYTIEGRSGFGFADAGFEVSADDLSSASIQPMIGAVQNLRVAGLDGAGVITDLPANPVVTWDPPALGTADSYIVVVVRFVPDGSRLVRRTRATFFTAGTSVILPGNILKRGEPHYIRVRALSHPGLAFERTVFANTYPRAWADRITTLFTP